MKFLHVLALAKACAGATVTYNWAVTWVWANPDGFARPVIGINGKWPCPPIVANVGDNIVINVVNQLGNETTGIHFHGMRQIGTTYMDGPSGVTQCSIPPGGTLTYNFTANPAGTFWYHSHNKGQYPDGFRGALIVRDPKDPFLGKYQHEFTLTISDWFWSQMPPLLYNYLSPSNGNGVEPAPNSTLVNDSQNVKYNISPGLTYRLRIINQGAMGANWFQIQDHPLTVIAVDGIPVEPVAADSIYITTAQRYDILFTAKSTVTQNYFFSSTLDQGMYGGDFDIAIPSAFGYLVYNPIAPLPKPVAPDTFNPVDDFGLVPLDGQKVLKPVDRSIVLDMIFSNDDYGINRATVNNQTYVSPKVPTLYTVLSAPASDVMNPKIYGIGSNPFVVKSGQIVEVVINNFDSGGHPWHMHGHQFQVVYRGAPNTPIWDGTQPTSQVPVRRDVVMVNTNSSAVWRFRADNPGVFLIHCHIEWHVEAGLTATLLEAPDLIRGTQKIPADHLRVCKLTNTQTSGNAAGNTKNYLDLKGQPTAPSQYDYGSLVGPKGGMMFKGRSRIDGPLEWKFE